MNVQINKESGFRNFAPKGREYRNLQNDKHLLERTRLAKRKEGFQRHEPCTNPLFVKETAAGYCPESDRFNTDVAGEAKAIHDYQINRKKMLIEKQRKENQEREEKRWKAIEEQQKKEEEYLKAIRGTSKNNVSSVEYDLITLNDKDEDGKSLWKYRKEMMIYKGACRAHKLYKKSTSVDYNPITGEPLPERIKIPERPKPPEITKK